MTPLTTPAENPTNTPRLWPDEATNEQPQSETGDQSSEKAGPFGPPPEVPYPALLDPPTVKDFSPVKTYDVRECQVILHLSKGKTHQFIRNFILPIPGAVALVGRKYLVHQWALNHALLQRSVSPGPTNPKRVAQMSRARSKRRGQSPLTSSETLSTSSGEKS
jgi:hypothetical protein